jgi:hypothetical protein
MRWSCLGSGEEERSAASVEERQQKKAADEEQIEAAPPASKVEVGEGRRVGGKYCGEEQLFHGCSCDDLVG